MIGSVTKLSNLAALLFGIFLAVAIGEGALRLLKPPQVSVAHAPCIYEPDPVYGYRFRPNAEDRMQKNFEIDSAVRINSLGFHDVEHTPAVSDTFRILALGDSFTVGLEVEREAGWTQRLQNELRGRGYSQVEVINLGLDGAGPDVHLALLKAYLPQLPPDMVILAFYKNDPNDLTEKRPIRECYKDYTLAYFDAAQGAQMRAFIDGARRPGPLFSGLFENLYLFRLSVFLIGQDWLWQNDYLNPIRNFYTPAMLGLEADNRREDPADINQILGEFQMLAQQHGFRLLVVPVPANNTWNRPTDSIEAFQQAVSEPVQAQVEVVDVLPAMQAMVNHQGRRYHHLFWRFDEHLNGYGHQVFGQAVAQEIDRYLKNSPIELQVSGAREGLWTAVQWQDGQGDWHAVENWQGAPDGGGKIRWWVAEKDFGSGPFRWAVLAGAGEELLATSKPFYLPGPGQSLRIKLALDP
jgi:lysophospholipase L1-like esterase